MIFPWLRAMKMANRLVPVGPASATTSGARGHVCSWTPLDGYELFSAALGVIPGAIYGRRVSVRVRHGLVRVSRLVL